MTRSARCDLARRHHRQPLDRATAEVLWHHSSPRVGRHL